MNKTDFIRAWKDPIYRGALTAEELGDLPANPAGMVELSDEQLKVAGGSNFITTAPTCTVHSFANWRACGCWPTTA